MNDLNHAIDQTLNELLTNLEQITGKTVLTANAIAKPLVIIQEKSQQLEGLLRDYGKPEFPFELYETGSMIIEIITQIRLGQQRKEMQNLGCFPTLNHIVDIIRHAVYKHPALSAQAEEYDQLTKPLQATDLEKAIYEAQAKVNLAMNKANIASDVAEKANDEGGEFLQKIQLQQTSKQVDQNLLNRSIDHSLVMYAKNAAAVIAADAAAKTLNMLEDLLGNANQNN